ncbi:3,4-dihydroxy 2-butanone 4-phosphate synthase [Tilletia horrida]|uniref:3,4-dihydroxy-2-butanone 4-phosphate synthase n=1 Tax=Tilletia horrida TaxID=155126 RepID=A0AAN6GU13_9BASI|nr:3,4-dihydroxy 2-butanone 4-phosphate synthase [Tilletia horrida]KAK0555968.1 3,4-dihydroxy 2-butanone 4-phosphate synthase [Tilletia horrida]KAK0568856.1 3,4-dihydroxy 2-butanone 4-phosphate synthase [Tilletia horrida]
MSPIPAESSSSSAVHVNGVSQPTTELADIGNNITFDSVEDTIAAFGRGEFVVILDDETRENEGDLIIAADRVTTEQMAWLIKHSSGFVCISIPEDTIEYLGLRMMVPENTDRHKTAYTVTLDYKSGTTTGISAHDRALTCRMLARASDQVSKRKRTSQSVPTLNGAATSEADSPSGSEADAQSVVLPEHFSRPGHMNPLRYTEGGVQKRRGHTEAAVDLAIAAGRSRAGILCELVDPDSPVGGIAARDACFKFARNHGLRICTIEALVQWQRQREQSSTS